VPNTVMGSGWSTFTATLTVVLETVGDVDRLDPARTQLALDGVVVGERETQTFGTQRPSRSGRSSLNQCRTRINLLAFGSSCESWRPKMNLVPFRVTAYVACAPSTW
jgi:hypothetical protein